MTQTKLKTVAMGSMLLDHAAKVLVAAGVLYPYISGQTAMMLYEVMVTLGRIAFPIFAWFVAEGCQKTKSPGRYLFRLGCFAVLSEIPFQYCFYGAGYYGLQLGCHNVLFTFFFAAAAILLPRGTGSKVLLAAMALLLGWYLQTDYNAWGIALVLGLYYLPKKSSRLLFIAVWCLTFYLLRYGFLITQAFYAAGALGGVVLLCFYTGQQGRGCKWLFYVFYPAHLSALYVLRILFAM